MMTGLPITMNFRPLKRKGFKAGVDIKDSKIEEPDFSPDLIETYLTTEKGRGILAKNMIEPFKQRKER